MVVIALSYPLSGLPRLPQELVAMKPDRVAKMPEKVSANRPLLCLSLILIHAIYFVSVLDFNDGLITNTPPGVGSNSVHVRRDDYHADQACEYGTQGNALYI